MSYPEEAPQRPLLELRILHAGTHQRHCHPVVTPGQGLLQDGPNSSSTAPTCGGGERRQGTPKGPETDPNGATNGTQKGHKWDPKGATNGTQKGPPMGPKRDTNGATNGTPKEPPMGP